MRLGAWGRVECSAARAGRAAARTLGLLGGRLWRQHDMWCVCRSPISPNATTAAGRPRRPPLHCRWRIPCPRLPGALPTKPSSLLLGLGRRGAGHPLRGAGPRMAGRRRCPIGRKRLRYGRRGFLFQSLGMDLPNYFSDWTRRLWHPTTRTHRSWCPSHDRRQADVPRLGCGAPSWGSEGHALERIRAH